MNQMKPPRPSLKRPMGGVISPIAKWHPTQAQPQSTWYRYLIPAVVSLISVFLMYRSLPAIERIRSRTGTGFPPKLSSDSPQFQNCHQRSFFLSQIPRNKVFFFRSPKDSIRENLPDEMILDRRVYPSLGFGDCAILLYLTPKGHFSMDVCPHLSSATLDIFSCSANEDEEEKVRVAVEEATESKMIELDPEQEDGGKAKRMDEFQSFLDQMTDLDSEEECASPSEEMSSATKVESIPVTPTQDEPDRSEMMAPKSMTLGSHSVV